MTYSRYLTIATLLALVFTSTASAATREEKRVADATDVLDQLLRIPEKTIPPTLLARAYAVAVVPNVRKAAFWLGVRRGKGILVVRQDDNSWSNPRFRCADRWQHWLANRRAVDGHYLGLQVAQEC